MRLPNLGKTLIPRDKIEGYLLSSIHPVGRYKAAFFASLGYKQAEWQTLEQDLRALVTGDAHPVEETITGPDGVSAAIVTAWMVRDTEDFPRFITAYPED